jgi:hypothetical protein
MSGSAPSGTEFLSGSRLASPELEEAYRRHHLRDDARNAAIVFGTFVLMLVLFLPSDLRLLGPSRTFFWLLGKTTRVAGLACGPSGV